MKSYLARFESFLHEQGLRLTSQRTVIFKAIYGTHQHLTADELFESIRDSRRKEDPKISRATVYRTLALMEEGGYVESVDVGRDHALRYEHILGHHHHDHLVCVECGAVVEFSDADLEKVQLASVARYGFEITSHRLYVYGTCPKCLKSARDGAKGQKDEPLESMTSEVTGE